MLRNASQHIARRILHSNGKQTIRVCQVGRTMTLRKCFFSNSSKLQSQSGTGAGTGATTTTTTAATTTTATTIIGGSVLHTGVGKWLMMMSGSVALLVSVGGITRLTHSGLSIVEWKPVTGILPPVTRSQWEEEFDKYKGFPEFQLVNKDMTVEEFKSIYFWEWFHRVLGRLVGLGFAGGMVYHRKQLSGRLLAACCLLLLGIGAQGALGWYMVKSGLEHATLEYEPRVAATRLTAHLGTAFLLFSGMLWTGLGQLVKAPAVALSEPAWQLSSTALRWSKVVSAMVFCTAMSGALVAGIRAGHTYNTFPLMAGKLLPDGYLALQPAHRNFVENDACVQFNHRLLAISTYAAIVALSTKLLRHRSLLSKRAHIANIHLLAFGSLQVALGISTLLLFVPIPLAATHQAGSLAVLGSALWLTQELRALRLKPVL